MPSANLTRKRAKLQSPINSFPRRERAGFTKNNSRSRKARGLPKRSVIRRRHKRY